MEEFADDDTFMVSVFGADAFCSGRRRRLCGAESAGGRSGCRCGAGGRVRAERGVEAVMVVVAFGPIVAVVMAEAVEVVVTVP